MSKVHNFSAGPCILPDEVFQKSSESILNFNNSGLSLIEISHRSKDFVEVMDEARKLVKDILEVPETHDVLYKVVQAWVFDFSLQFNGRT